MPPIFADAKDKEITRLHTAHLEYEPRPQGLASEVARFAPE